MGCKQSTTRQRASSQNDRTHRSHNGSHNSNYKAHGTQPKNGMFKPSQLQLRQQSRTSSQQSSRNSSRFPSQKNSPTLPPVLPIPPPPPRTETATGRLGRARLYGHASPLTTTSTSSSSYFCSTNSDDDEEYDCELALIMTPHGKGSGGNRSRDSSPSNGEPRTIHVVNGHGGGLKMNRSLTASQRRAIKGRINRSRRRANLHAQARRISDEFAQKSTGDKLHPNGDVSIPYGRAGGSFVIEDINGADNGGDNEYYDDGCEAAGGGGFFAGERKFLPYKYKNVHDPSHYCSSTAMVIVAGSNGYKGSGMGSVMKSASSPHIGKSSSSPLGFRRQRRKHIKHSSSQGTLAGSPCGPGSAIVSSSSPLGFRRAAAHRRTKSVKISSTEGSPIGCHSSASPKFKNSSSTTAPNNGSVGSGGPVNRSASVAYSSPNNEVSCVGNMIMSHTLGPPETNGYYFGSNISHNTTNTHTNNSSQSSCVSPSSGGKNNNKKMIMNGSSSVTVVSTLKNNIFYQKCGAGGVHDDDDEYFI